MSASLDDMKSLLKEAESRGDMETAQKTLVRIEEMQQEVKPESEMTASEKAINIAGAVVEPAIAIASGVPAAIVAEGAGFGSMLNRSLGIDTGTAKANREAVYDAMMYQPRTEGGQESLEFISTPFRWFGEQTEGLGQQAKDYTGSEMYGELTRALLEWFPASRIAKGAKNPYMKERVAKKMLEDATGARLDVAKDAIKKADPEYTAGQASVPSRSTEGAALWKSAEGRKPTDYDIVHDWQQDSRLKRLDDIARPDERAFMERIQKGVSDNLYGAGRQGALPEAGVRSVVNQIDETIKANPLNKRLLAEMKALKKGFFDEKGNIRTDAQQVFSAVDGIRMSLKNKEFGPVQHQLNNLKKSIVDLSDMYKQGDKFYAETSRPITQMKVAEVLKDSLKKKYTTPDERATGYATAMDNQKATLRKEAKGRPFYNAIDEAMSKEQMDVFNKIGEELSTNAKYKSQAAKGSQMMAEKVGDVTSIPKARILERTFVILNSLLHRLEGRYSRGGLDVLSELGKPQNRAKLNKFLDEISPEEKAAIMDLYKFNKRDAVTSAIVGAEHTDAAQEAGE